MNNNGKTKSNDSQGQDCTSRNNHESDKWNPRKFLMEIREEAVAASFAERDRSMTLDLLISQCHALVITNQEIWERCKPFHCTTISSADSQPDKCIFYRVRYLNVKATTVQHCKDNLKFESVEELTKESFEIPISLPARLECLVVHPRTEKNDIMPNYELFLKRSMLLMDDLLPGFLLEFKGFLENQQIGLGKVDEWLIQADEDSLFLKNQFNVNIPCETVNWQQLGSRFVSWETCRLMLASVECSRCRATFQYHNQNEQNGWVVCKSVVQQSGCFPMANGPRLLRQYTYPGTINVQFCMDIPSDRSRLIKFLEFVRHN